MTSRDGTSSSDHAALRERATLFAEDVVAFALGVPVGPVTRPLVDQLVRSGTSIGANLHEADDADSRKDFRYRIGISLRESKETQYWLRLIVKANPPSRDHSRKLYKEAAELRKIFAKIRQVTK
ncbi:MAG: four helix bundle protein [Planctomycetota bacterium]